MNHRRRTTLKALGAALALAPIGSALAQAYPTRPIRLVNPFAAGGTVDVLARLIGKEMGADLGQSIVVENQPGAGGTVGSAAVARAAPDGYTLIVSNVASHAIGVALYASLPYDPIRDFEHIGMFGTLPNALVVATGSPIKSLAELIDAAKTSREKLTFGSAGNGSTPHLSAELLKHQAKIDAVHVPYKGAGPAMQDLIGGRLSFLFENLPTAISLAKSGKLRILGTTGAKRAPMLGDVPTLAEQGLPEFVVETWHGMSAPVGTPRLIIERLNGSLRKALAGEDLRKRLTELGVSPADFTPDQYRNYMAAEIEKWGRIVKLSGAKIG